MSFNNLGLSSPLLAIIEKQGYTKAYPIQLEAIPAILQRKDVLGAAQTGSGKTAGFVLPILELLQRKKADRKLHVRVSILVPTRELALQISEVVTLFSEDLPNKVKNLAVFGGVPLDQQMKQLKGTEILIATPGRLLDMVGTNSIHLGKVEILVLDEADKMLEMNFEEEMNDILRLIPKARQNILFSATLNPKLDRLKEKSLSNPVVIQIEAEEKNIDLIEQKAYMLSLEQKGPALRKLIEENEMQQVLVFASSIRTADNIANKLNKHGIKAAALHSKKTQSARMQALKDFKNGNIQVLTATDLASRGIDIQFLPFVVNYELPRSPKDYVHRIGRTGRAESPGTAISLITMEEEHHFYIIQKKMGKRVEKIDWRDESF
ncbi:ATP-dependent RNA helicase RhlE [Spirosomataceae bacterium TFI 002]|nr:ATP-dependent RNA helicase RhlE [Spirosomataceae bacterium TFI 002]